MSAARRQNAWKPPVGILSTVLAALLAGCGTGTEPGLAPVVVTGSWSYEGAQQAPVPATLDGSLEISRQDGPSFEGSLDVFESSAEESRRITGIVTGIALDAVTLDFDVLVDGVSRRHVAEIRGDTIEGAWVEVRTGGASGSFRAVKAAAP